MDTDGEKIAAGERGRRAQKREENRLAWINHPNLMAENHARKRERRIYPERL
jgi:hypothetical protein